MRSSPSRRCVNASSRTWAFLEALLQAELEEREERLVELAAFAKAHLPRMKTLEEFDFARNPKISATTDLRTRARRLHRPGWEPVIFIGDSGTGKTHLHLLTGLAIAACRQKRRVRFTTAAALINEMVEAGSISCNSAAR